MSDYGSHPTRFGSLSDAALYGMYRSSVWSTLSEDQRLDLLQETVNRDAAQRGEIGSPKVEFGNLSATVSGQEGGGRITMNREMFVNDRQITDYNGQLIARPLEDANMRALTTCIHENIHAWQDQCVDGTIPCANAALLAEYRANQFDVSAVMKPDGAYGRGQQYLRGETPNGFYLYKLQSTERDAFRWSEEKTLAVMQELTQRYGAERSFAVYQQELRTNGYQADVLRAAGLFQNPNIELDINRTLMNEYYAQNLPVDPNTERAVRNEMLKSYAVTHPMSQLNPGQQQNNAGTGGKSGMKEISDWMDLHTSPEEYDASLRGTVNAFYQHELNTGATQEEAMQNTMPLAESYLQASQEFSDYMAANNGANNGMAGGAGASGGVGGNGASGGLGGNGASGGVGGNGVSGGVGGNGASGGVGGNGASGGVGGNGASGGVGGLGSGGTSGDGLGGGQTGGGGSLDADGTPGGLGDNGQTGGGSSLEADGTPGGIGDDGQTGGASGGLDGDDGGLGGDDDGGLGDE